MPWGTITHYQVSRDLNYALQQQFKQQGEYYSILIGALINVPIIESNFQHHYHALIIPALVKNVFVRQEKCVWHSRSQFISKNNLNFRDNKQLKYLQHDYSRFNQWIIKKSWQFWENRGV